MFLYSAWATSYSGGTGIVANPYQIGSYGLDYTTTTEGDWDKAFVLIADIDFAGDSYARG